MPLTRVTDNVVTQGTIAPGKLSTGAPVWNSSGVLSATGFVGDGSNLLGIGVSATNKLINQTLTANYIDGYITAQGFIGDGSGITNLFPAASVIEVTDNFFTLEPKHNNCTIVLNSLSTIDIDIYSLPFPAFSLGHSTQFIQYNIGRGKFITSEIFNADSFYETKKQYAVCQLFKTDISLGWTLYGELTSTTLTSAPPPVTPVNSLSLSFSAINAGDNTSFALSGIRLFATGNNNSGEFGFNDVLSRSRFTQLTGTWTTNIIINNGDLTTYILSGAVTDKELFVCGGNDSGQLGLNNAGSNPNYFLTSRSTFTRVTIPNNPRFTSIKGGSRMVAALSGDGDLYVCGNNAWGQLGLNSSGDGDNYANSRSTFTRVTSAWNGTTTTLNPKFNYVSTDNPYILAALSATGDLFVCGYNGSGALGLNNTSTLGNYLNSRSTLTRVTIPNNPKFTKVGGTWGSTIALSSTGDLFVTGHNYRGQLGLNSGGTPSQVDLSDRSTFTRVTSAWNQGTLILNPKFTDVVTGAGGLYWNLVLSGTDLYGAGESIRGEMGFGDTQYRSIFTKIPGSWNIVKKGSQYHTLALSGNVLFTTGYNFNGQLGLDDRINRLTFTQITGVAIPV